MIQNLIIAVVPFESGCWPIRLIKESRGSLTGLLFSPPPFCAT
jgi:hypothetical protein